MRPRSAHRRGRYCLISWRYESYGVEHHNCRCSRLEGRESGTPVASNPCSERKFWLVSKFRFGTIDGKLPHTIIGKIMTFVKTDLQPSHLSADFSRDFLQGMNFAGRNVEYP